MTRPIRRLENMIEREIRFMGKRFDEVQRGRCPTCKRPRPFAGSRRLWRPYLLDEQSEKEHGPTICAVCILRGEWLKKWQREGKVNER